MGVTDFLGKKKKQIGDSVSSLGATAKNFTDSLSKKTGDYFRPTSEVRVRDFVREVPKATFDTGKSMFQGTYNVATKAPKIFGEGIAYATSKNVRDEYKKGNLDILPTISKTTPTSMLADTGRAGLEVVTAGKGPKWATSPKITKRLAFGGGTGYGFDVLGRAAEEGKIEKETFKPGIGTVAGTILGGAAKPATEIVREGIDQTKRFGKGLSDSVKQDIKTFTGPAPTSKRVVYDIAGKKKTVDEITKDVTEKAYREGQPMFTNEVLPEALRIAKLYPSEVEVKTLPKKYVTPSFLKSSVPQPGMSIKAVKSPVDEIIDAEVDVMKSIKNDGGVSLMSTEPDSVSKLRVSTNPRWYSEFYKANGRKPNQQEIREIAKRSLESGSGYLSTEYKEALKNLPLVPTNKNTQVINEVNTKKNAAAAELVQKMKSGKINPIEKFTKDLDAIPTPWGKESPVVEPKKTPVVAPSEPIAAPKGQFNEYQQAAFNKKQERIKAIKEISEAPTVLRAMGFTKKEVSKLGVEEAKLTAELGKLGYPKDDAILRDVRSETVKRILEHQVPYKSLKEYYARKHELDTKILDGIDPKTLKDISPLQAGTRDVYRNMEDVFGPNYSKVKAELLDPFDASKGEFIRDQETWIKELGDNVVNKFGFTKGSKESAAIQRYGDTDLPEGERLSYEQLVQEFGKEKADQIVEADGWFRATYDNMIDELNRIREYYFPTHPLYPESTKIIPKRANYYRHYREMVDGVKGLLNIFDSPANIDPALAVSSQFTKPLSKWLSFAKKREGNQTEIDAVGGFLDYIKANAYAKHIDPHIQRFRGVDAEMKANLPKGDFFDDKRIGLAEELSRKSDPFERIAEVSDVSKIKNFLIEKGLQDRDALKMAKDLAGIKDVVAVKEYLGKNLSMEGFSDFKSKALAEDSENKLNNFLKFLDNFTNDLAGKTNPIDRPVQDNFLGRPVFRAINWVNSRVKANVILGNVSSAVAQFFSIPNGIANAGVRNSVPAIGDSLVGMFKDDVPSMGSTFLRERYFNGYDKFDPGVIANSKRFAVWLTSLGDKVGTTFTWNAQYRKALAEGVADPVKYADDWTRKMVAGRGIGEVPIAQKSKLFQIIAPFQLEVANQWRVFGDWAKNDPSKLVLAKKLIEYSVAVWIMNQIAKEIRGSDVAFDPMEAMLDAYETFQNEENMGKGIALAGGRVAGEVISNIPFVSEPIARVYPEYGKKDILGTGIDLPTREQFFGDKDPTRFGGGLVASKGLTDPLYMLIPPFGGRQIKNTIDGTRTLLDGYAQTEAGKVMTPVDATIPNIMKGVLTGKNALDEVQEYRANDQTPLSEDQTEKFKIGGKNYFQEVMNSRAAENEKVALAIPSQLRLAQAGAVQEQGIHQLKDGSFYVPSLTGDQKTFKTEQQAKFAIEKESFEASGENFRDIGDYVMRLNPDGTSKMERKDVFTTRLLTSKLAVAKKNENFEEWQKLATQKFDLLTRLIEDPTVDELDRSEYESALATLMDDFAKFKGYGGAFTKGKKGKKLEEKYRYPLIDKELMNIAAIRSGSKNPIIVKRAPSLVRRRMKKVRKVRK